MALNGFSWSRALLVALGGVWLWFAVSDLRYDDSGTMRVFFDAFRFGLIFLVVLMGAELVAH